MRNLARKIKFYLHKKRSNWIYKYKTLVVENVDDIILRDRYFYIERKGKKDKWLHFLCPCGCGETIDVNLMKSHKPYWTIKKSMLGELTLFPSVNKINGCKSHFFVKKSKIIWVKDYHPIPKNLF